MKKKPYFILGIIQAFVAIGAIPAGLSMIIDPDGTSLGMSIEFLINSPFHNFFIPGLFLFIINGLFNLASGFLSFIRNRYSGLFGLILGISLVLWIALQVYFIGLSSFMQPMFFFIGIIEIGLSLFIIFNKNGKIQS